MRVAITGANGFIGQHLVREFGDAGWTVRPVVRADYAARRLDDAFADADAVVHAAGVTRAPTRAGLTANVTLARETALAAATARVPRVVFISSQAAAGPADALAVPTTEEMTPAPMEAYGRSKLDAEQAARTLVPAATILRPAAVYGPGDRDFLAMHRLARRGLAVHPGTRAQWISIVHVHDLARGVRLATSDEGARGDTFFLANEAPVQWGELFRLTAACANRPLRVDVDLPPALVRTAARFGDLAARVRGHAGLLTTEKVRLGAPTFWICSSARARTRFDFRTPTALRDGLCETYHWYERNGWL